MRLTGIDLLTDGANIVSLGISEVGSAERYLLKAAVGLDAGDIVHKFYGFAQGSTTERFYNFKLTKRDIVLRIVLNPNYSVGQNISDLRDELYAAISANRSGLIDVMFKSGGAAAAKLVGYITKFEVPHFSKVPEVQITITCDDPMLRGITPMKVDIATLPTANPIVISDNESTAPHGFQMVCVFTAITPSFTIQSAEISPDWSFEVTPVTPFQVDDILLLSSEFGNKRLLVDDGSSIIQLMDRLTPGSVWPTIFRGNNEFWFPELANFDWVELTHYAAHWGV